MRLGDLEVNFTGSGVFLYGINDNLYEPPTNTENQVICDNGDQMYVVYNWV